MLERRLNERRAFHHSIQYQFDEPEEVGAGVAYDLSESGIKISINEFLPLDQKIYLRFDMKDHRLMECLSKVVWVAKMPNMDRYQIGLSFENDDSGLQVQKDVHQYFLKGLV